MAKKLILFDIDGTLTHTKNKYGPFYDRFPYAVKKVFKSKVNITESVTTQGKTDKQIFIELCKVSGISRNDAIKQLPSIYRYATLWSRKNISNYEIVTEKGVVALLKSVRKKGYHIALVTGNLKEIAKMKLKQAGLGGFFTMGAFGEISEHRSDLLDFAIKDASKRIGMKLTKKDVIYIGDTPIDVDAGKRAGVETIAVATGTFSFASLKRERPDHLLKDLSNTKKVIGIIEK